MIVYLKQKKERYCKETEVMGLPIMGSQLKFNRSQKT